MKRVAVILGALVLTGCGGADPNQSVADRLVSHSLVDLDQLCGRAQVEGDSQAERWVIGDIYSGAGRGYASAHVFTDGATPHDVAAELVSRC